MTEDQRAIAEMIVGNIDDYGYLQASVDELSFSTNIGADKILEVLSVVQTFHPPGVGARDLRECLLLQLERANRQNSLEYLIVDKQMDALGKRRLPDIARGLGKPIEEVQEAVGAHRSSRTAPGTRFPARHGNVCGAGGVCHQVGG